MSEREHTHNNNNNNGKYTNVKDRSLLFARFKTVEIEMVKKKIKW